MSEDPAPEQHHSQDLAALAQMAWALGHAHRQAGFTPDPPEHSLKVAVSYWAGYTAQDPPELPAATATAGEHPETVCPHCGSHGTLAAREVTVTLRTLHLAPAPQGLTVSLSDREEKTDGAFGYECGYCHTPLALPPGWDTQR
jgi:hypothetical protein